MILLVSLAFFSMGSIPESNDNDARLRDLVGQYGQAEVTVPYSDIKSIDDLTRRVSILSVRDKLIHISLSPLTVEWFILQKFNYSIKESAENKGIISSKSMNQAMEWDKYPTYPQYDSIMQSFVRLYPSLCHLDTIGTSIKGKLILALKISDNAAKDEDEPEVFYSSSMHGDEIGGFVLMLRLADYLLKNYNINSRVKNLVDNLEIWINPLSNPDGTYRTGNTITSPTRFNSNGVDLNRNFPDPFQPLEKQEKENIEMISFMRKHRFVLSANFHTGSELVNYPWDRWLSKIHADDDWFYDISRAYADTVHLYSGTGYMTELNNGITRGALWYVIYGGRQDFITWELHGREVTIELDDQTITPESQLPLLWQYNWHSLIGYLENALYGIHGIVLDSSSSLPVQAKVFIAGHDKDSSQVYSDKLTGSFYRFLSPGSWNLIFTAPGYNYLTVNNIKVVAGENTDVIVRMTPAIDSVFTRIKETPVLYPNPATTYLKAALPERIIGSVDISIFSLSGMLILNYKTEVFKEVPVQINIKGLPAGVYAVVFTNTVTKLTCSSRLIVIK